MWFLRFVCCVGAVCRRCVPCAHVPLSPAVPRTAGPAFESRAASRAAPTDDAPPTPTLSTVSARTMQAYHLAGEVAYSCWVWPQSLRDATPSGTADVPLSVAALTDSSSTADHHHLHTIRDQTNSRGMVPDHQEAAAPSTVSSPVAPSCRRLCGVSACLPLTDSSSTADQHHPHTTASHTNSRGMVSDHRPTAARAAVSSPVLPLCRCLCRVSACPDPLSPVTAADTRTHERHHAAPPAAQESLRPLTRGCVGRRRCVRWHLPLSVTPQARVCLAGPPSAAAQRHGRGWHNNDTSQPRATLQPPLGHPHGRFPVASAVPSRQLVKSIAAVTWCGEAAAGATASRVAAPHDSNKSEILPDSEHKAVAGVLPDRAVSLSCRVASFLVSVVPGPLAPPGLPLERGQSSRAKHRPQQSSSNQHNTPPSSTTTTNMRIRPVNKFMVNRHHLQPYGLTNVTRGERFATFFNQTLKETLWNPTPPC